MSEAVTLGQKATELRFQALKIYENMKESRSFDPAALEAIMALELERAKALAREARADAKAAVREAQVLLADGRQLTSRQSSPLIKRILIAFKPTSLCLKPCMVNTDGHPGLHVGRLGEEGHAACALPAELPHAFCMCYPGDVRRFAICPYPGCGKVVPVRAAKRHVEAHLGVNRKDPRVARAEKLADVKAWLEAHPEASGLMTETRNYSGTSQLSLGYLVSRHAGDLERGKDGGFWLKAARQGAAKLGVALPEAMRAKLATKVQGAWLEGFAKAQAHDVAYAFLGPIASGARAMVQDIYVADLFDAVEDVA